MKVGWADSSEGFGSVTAVVLGLGLRRVARGV